MNSRVAAASFLLLAFSFTPSVAQQPTWAAATPDSERRIHTGHGATKEQAQNNALQACRRVSRTCADRPAYTDSLEDYFLLSCCVNPRLACLISVIEPQQPRSMPDSAAKDFADAGFSACSIIGGKNARP